MLPQRVAMPVSAIWKWWFLVLKTMSSRLAVRGFTPGREMKIPGPYSG